MIKFIKSSSELAEYLKNHKNGELVHIIVEDVPRYLRREIERRQRKMLKKNRFNQ